jgi:hypothetical protein
MATRGLIYSLIGLVLNPFAMMSIGGFVLGIRSLRRAPQFVEQNARRGPAIAAIALGAVGTVITAALITVAIAIPILQGQRGSVHVFDRAGAEQDLVSELATGNPDNSAATVSCPPDAAMKIGDTFDCTATLGDGRTMPVHMTIGFRGGVYTYSWTANLSEASGGSPSTGAFHAGNGVPATLPAIKQELATEFLGQYGVAVSKIDCPTDASLAPSAFFECVVTLADNRTARVQISMSSGSDGGYSTLLLIPPASASNASDPDLSHS